MHVGGITREGKHRVFVQATFLVGWRRPRINHHVWLHKVGGYRNAGSILAIKMLRGEFERDVADVAIWIHPPASLMSDRYTRDALLSEANMTCLHDELQVGILVTGCNNIASGHVNDSIEAEHCSGVIMGCEARPDGACSRTAGPHTPLVTRQRTCGCYIGWSDAVSRVQSSGFGRRMLVVPHNQRRRGARVPN